MGHRNYFLPARNSAGSTFVSVAVSALLLLAGCATPVYQHSFGDACWRMEDTLSVAIPAEVQGPFFLTLDLDQDFAYRNLYLKVLLGSTPLLVSDTFQDEAGNWQVPLNGKTATIRFDQPLEPEVGKPATLKIYHFMRDASLCHVRALRVEQAK